MRDGDGPTLVLPHGWPEFWYTWQKNIPALPESFDVVVPDLRGFGDSDKPSNVPNVSDYTDDLIELLDALNIDRAGFVGHDLGAFVIQDLAQRYRGQIDRLFFFNCPHPGIGTRWLDNGHYKELWYQAFNQMDWSEALVGHNRDTCRLYLRHFPDHWSHSLGRFDQDLEAWVDNFMKPGNLEGGFNWYRAVAEYRQKIIDRGVCDESPIDVPCYVLWGKTDAVLRSEWSDNIQEQFSNAIVEIAEYVGHFVHYEQPSLANQRIMSFFSGQ